MGSTGPQQGVSTGGSIIIGYTDLGTKRTTNLSQVFLTASDPAPIDYDGTTSPSVNPSAYSTIIAGTAVYTLQNLYYYDSIHQVTLDTLSSDAGEYTVTIKADWGLTAGGTNANQNTITQTVSAHIVVRATGSVTFTDGNGGFTYTGGTQYPHFTVNPSAPYTLSIVNNATGKPDYPINVGTYTATVSINSPSWVNSPYQGVRSVLINKARGSLSFASGTFSLPYTGYPISAVQSPTLTLNSRFSDPPAVTVTYNGSTTLPTAIGVYQVAASVTNSNFLIDPASYLLEITKANQSFNSIPSFPDVVSTAAPITFVLPTVSSGLPVSVSLTGPATLSGNTITLSGDAGRVGVTFSQAGDAQNAPYNYTVYFNVTKVTQTIFSFASIPYVVQGTPRSFTIVPPVSSSGLPVTVTVLSGPASISGNTITTTGAIGTVTLAANQPGNQYISAAAQVTTTFAVGKMTQSLVFSKVPSSLLYNGGSFTFIPPTSQSGAPVTITISGVGTLSSNTVTLTGSAGSITLTATTPETASYAAASVNVTTQILKDTTVISGFPQINNAIAGTPYTLPTLTSSNPGVPIVYSVVSGPATISGNILTFSASGRVTVAADQAGDSLHTAAAKVTTTFTVSSPIVSFTFTEPFSVPFTGQEQYLSVTPSIPGFESYFVQYTDSFGHSNVDPKTPGTYTAKIHIYDPIYVISGPDNHSFTIQGIGAPIYGPFITGVDTTGWATVGVQVTGFLQYLFGYQYNPGLGIPTPGSSPGAIVQGASGASSPPSSIFPITVTGDAAQWFSFDSNTGFFYGIPNQEKDTNLIVTLADGRHTNFPITARGGGSPVIKLKSNFKIPIYNVSNLNRYYASDFVQYISGEAEGRYGFFDDYLYNVIFKSVTGPVNISSGRRWSDSIIPTGTGLVTATMYIPYDTVYNDSNLVTVTFEVRQEEAYQYIYPFPKLPSSLSVFTAPFSAPSVSASSNLPVKISILDGPAFIAPTYGWWGGINGYIIFLTGEPGTIILQADQSGGNGWAEAIPEYAYIVVAAEDPGFNQLNEFGAGSLF